MTRTNAKRRAAESHSDVHVPTKEAVNLAVITPTSDVQAVHSPANHLRASLEQALEGGWASDQSMGEVAVKKIPFGWTLIGMSAICAAFWYAIAALIF